MKKKEAATKNPVILGSSTTGIPEDGIVRAPESTLNGLEIDNEPAEEWDPLLDAKSSGLIYGSNISISFLLGCLQQLRQA